jgi:putative tricarboxylic transport membrane protein
MEKYMEIVFNAFIGVILLIFLVGSRFISDETVASDVLGSRGFPIIFSIIGLVLLAVETITTLRGKTKKESVEGEASFTPGGAKRAGLIVALLLGYIVAVTRIGFVLTTLVFVFSAVRIIGYKNWKLIIIFSVLMTALLVAAFGRIFFVPLPRGTGILKELSYFLY